MRRLGSARIRENVNAEENQITVDGLTSPSIRLQKSERDTRIKRELSFLSNISLLCMPDSNEKHHLFASNAGAQFQLSLTMIKCQVAKNQFIIGDKKLMLLHRERAGEGETKMENEKYQFRYICPQLLSIEEFSHKWQFVSMINE